MVDAVCRIIGQNLDDLAGDSRTRVALLAYDSNIHFFNLQPSLTQPSVMVMTDMDDPFLPTSSNDLLVNLEESREVSADKKCAAIQEYRSPPLPFSSLFLFAHLLSPHPFPFTALTVAAR